VKLAFSTLGCSGLPLRSVADLAERTGWQGVEVRSAADEPVHAGSPPAIRAAARADLARITPVCIASYVRVATSTITDDDCVRALLAEAQLAKDLGAGAVRVFPGGDGPDPDNRAVRRLRAAANALPAGVQIWLETHDSHPRGQDIARVLRRVDHPQVRAIWDIAHPWLHGEEAIRTAQLLRPWLAHVQVKDQATVDDRTPVPLGTGVLPLRHALRALADLSYQGWLSLEWERKWHPTAAPIEEALPAARTWLTARPDAWG
jgi:sugar phosphate isomerase/epimerase